MSDNSVQGGNVPDAKSVRPVSGSWWANTWFLIPVLLFSNAGLGLSLFLQPGDAILYFNDLRIEPLNTLFKVLTGLGEAQIFVLGFVACLFIRFRFSAMILIAGLLTIPISYQLKDSIGKDRPITWFQDQGRLDELVLVPGVHLNTGKTSFPSGHTTAAFNVWGLLAGISLLVGRKRLGLLFAAAAILAGISRIFLVQHFLTDVLAGILTGLAIATLVWWIDRQFLRKSAWLERKLKFN